MSRRALAKIEPKSTNVTQRVDELPLKPLPKRKIAVDQQENVQPEANTPSKPTTQRGKKSKQQQQPVVLVADGPISVEPQVQHIASAKPTEENSPTDAAVVPADRFNKLKERYEALKDLRETEVEKLYYDAVKKHQETQKAAEALITSLKQDKERLSLNAKENSDAGALVRFFGKLTGLAVQRLGTAPNADASVASSSSSGADDEVFLCEYTRRDVTLAFELTLRTREGHAEYSPRVPLDATLSGLPEYLSTDIVFADNELPAFLSKIQAHMARLLP